MNKWTVILILLLAIGLIGFLASLPDKPGEYDVLAQQITESEVHFYGAFWCPHCQEQKAQFGKSARLLPYIECSTPDGKGQLQVCKDLNITTYPTWIFADGRRQIGLISPNEFTEILKNASSSSAVIN